MNKLDTHNNKLDQRYKKLQAQIMRLQAQAKNNLQKSKQTKGSTSQMYKQKCLMALKKKKQLQGQIKGVLSNQVMINNVKMTAQNMNSHKQMMQNMQDVLKQQKQIMKTVNIDKLQDIRDQMLDMKFETDYMNQMMNRNYDMDMDQDQFEDQFAEFEKEVNREKKKVPANTNKNVINNKPINNNMNIYDDDFDVNKL